MSTVDLSERDNKETLFVKEEVLVTNDAEVFREVVVDVFPLLEPWMKSAFCLLYDRRLKPKGELRESFPAHLYIIYTSRQLTW